MTNLHASAVEAKVTDLSNALATLGRGTTFPELIKLTRLKGYTTQAELALTMALLDMFGTHIDAATKIQNNLLTATKIIVKAE